MEFFAVIFTKFRSYESDKISEVSHFPISTEFLHISSEITFIYENIVTAVTLGYLLFKA